MTESLRHLLEECRTEEKVEAFSKDLKEKKEEVKLLSEQAQLIINIMYVSVLMCVCVCVCVCVICVHLCMCTWHLYIRLVFVTIISTFQLNVNFGIQF